MNTLEVVQWAPFSTSTAKQSPLETNVLRGLREGGDVQPDVSREDERELGGILVVMVVVHQVKLS